MRFDWDESKKRINRVKHGIDFASPVLRSTIPLQSPSRTAM
jgi:uncharacterized DUF497 family protein